MIQTTQVIIWWIGAILCIAALGVVSWYALLLLEQFVAKRIVRITRLTTARYWVERMEREGLTACMKGYRKMVEERGPKVLADFEKIDRDWVNGDKP